MNDLIDQVWRRHSQRCSPSQVFKDSKNWVYDGPGSREGGNWVFFGELDPKPRAGVDCASLVREIFESRPEGLTWGLEGSRLTLRDVEFALCEFQKWLRTNPAQAAALEKRAAEPPAKRRRA